MRWFWIDRFTVLEDDRAQAIKNVTLAEEHLHDHFPGYPMMPRCLMIEGMAQTAGVMAGKRENFSRNVVLAKIQRATFHEVVFPGDRITYDAKMIESNEDGHRAEIRATVDGKLVGEAEMMFFNYRDPSVPEEEQKTFVFAENFAVLLGMNWGQKT
jgi:3-hydroxyacyl-[acyl-carrier-protein] dehydratase